MMSAHKQRLGRGLAALIGDSTAEDTTKPGQSDLRVPMDLLYSSPNNPRKTFPDADLDELSRSIRDKGLLQPLIVRSRFAGGYEIIAGERRWRAAQRAGLHELPVLIRELSDGEALEIALIENVQRSDLNPLEEARAYSLLVEQYNYTQQQLADSIGKSRSHISNTMRLMNLPEIVRQKIESGLLTAGHARALVATEHPEKLADEIIRLGLSVRKTEALTKPESQAEQRRPRPEKAADTKLLEKLVSDSLGLRTVIADHGQAGGTVTITYKSVEQLDEVCRRLAPSTTP